MEGKLYTKNELVWKRLSGLYGYTFVSQYGEEPTTEWNIALKNIPVDQIGPGIDLCADSPEFKTFPPNPMQFVALCLPKAEDYGLPSESEALNQAVGNSDEKHPAVIYTVRNITGGAYDLRQANTKSAKDMFGKEWAKTIAHVIGGGELPERPLEIQEEKHQALTKEERKAEMAKLRGGLDL